MARRLGDALLLAWTKMVPRLEGQDPLGVNLRVSARLSSQLLHCVTSITPRGRYFSFFPWCIRSIDSSEEADKFRQAIRIRETALTLGSVLHHEGQTCVGGALVGSKEAIKRHQRHGYRVVNLEKLQLSKNPAWDAYVNS